jgi:hypothetical protein
MTPPEDVDDELGHPPLPELDAEEPVASELDTEEPVVPLAEERGPPPVPPVPVAPPLAELMLVGWLAQLAISAALVSMARPNSAEVFLRGMLILGCGANSRRLPSVA